METIFWFITLILCLFAFLMIIYFYLAHDDLRRGKLTAFELTESLQTYIPVEIGLHTIITLVPLIHGNYYLVLLNVPVFLYNMKILKDKDFNYHAFTAQDYVLLGRNERILKIKMGFYVFLMLALLYRFMFSFSSMMIYHLFG